jgi:4-hydroxy-3-methylbut-2-enyl diphosphate reductase
VERFSARPGGNAYRIHFAQVEGPPSDPGDRVPLDRAARGGPGALDPSLAGLLAQAGPHLIEIPYLNLGENDFIYKFRPEKERNTAIYAQDAEAGAIYQSRLCAAIKTLARRHERTATAPSSSTSGPCTTWSPATSASASA